MLDLKVNLRTLDHKGDTGALDLLDLKVNTGAAGPNGPVGPKGDTVFWIKGHTD